MLTSCRQISKLTRRCSHFEKDNSKRVNLASQVKQRSSSQIKPTFSSRSARASTSSHFPCNRNLKRPKTLPDVEKDKNRSSSQIVPNAIAKTAHASKVLNEGKSLLRRNRRTMNFFARNTRIMTGLSIWRKHLSRLQLTKPTRYSQLQSNLASAS
jgi:hypothetical protein